MNRQKRAIDGLSARSVRAAFLFIAHTFGAKFMRKNVMTYTGYTFEALFARNDYWTNRLLELTDILVDGPYVESLRDLELQFRGSSNQRLLDRAAREEIAAELLSR